SLRQGAGCRLPMKPPISQPSEGRNESCRTAGRNPPASRAEKCLIIEGLNKGTKGWVRFATNSGSSLLKWLNSLYRPALPEGIRGRLVPPHPGQSVGASPSGKAVDFDSTMRRFESSRPSQAV